MPGLCQELDKMEHPNRHSADALCESDTEGEKGQGLNQKAANTGEQKQRCTGKEIFNVGSA